MKPKHMSAPAPVQPLVRRPDSVQTVTCECHREAAIDNTQLTCSVSLATALQRLHALRRQIRRRCNNPLASPTTDALLPHLALARGAPTQARMILTRLR